MTDPANKCCNRIGVLQGSYDVEAPWDQDGNRQRGRSPPRRVSSAEFPASLLDVVAETPRTPMTYAHRPRGILVVSRGYGRGSVALRPSHRSSFGPLLRSPRLHAIELKIEGPHLCDLPQNFTERLRAFLIEALGMAPLHMAVGQGCIHLVLMLLELGRGAGLAGHAAQRLRRRCTGSVANADVTSLPTRLLGFMREVLPDGGAAAPAHVTVRHNRQRTYGLGSSAAPSQPQQQQQQQQRQQAEEVGRAKLLQPRARADPAAAIVSGEDADAAVDAAAAAVSAVTDPAAAAASAAAAAVRMTATTTSHRTSAPASVAAPFSAGESSGGTWSSSGAGPGTMPSWIAWPLPLRSTRPHTILNAGSSSSIGAGQTHSCGEGGGSGGADGHGTGAPRWSHKVAAGFRAIADFIREGVELAAPQPPPAQPHRQHQQPCSDPVLQLQQHFQQGQQQQELQQQLPTGVVGVVPMNATSVTAPSVVPPPRLSSSPVPQQQLQQQQQSQQQQQWPGRTGRGFTGISTHTPRPCPVQLGSVAELAEASGDEVMEMFLLDDHLNLDNPSGLGAPSASHPGLLVQSHHRDGSSGVRRPPGISPPPCTFPWVTSASTGSGDLEPQLPGAGGVAQSVAAWWSLDAEEEEKKGFGQLDSLRVVDAAPLEGGTCDEDGYRYNAVAGPVLPQAALQLTLERGIHGSAGVSFVSDNSGGDDDGFSDMPRTAAVMSPATMAAAAACNSSNNSGVESAASAWRQPRSDVAAGGGASAATAASALPTSLAVLDPMLAGRLGPSAGSAAVGWTGPSYPPSARAQPSPIHPGPQDAAPHQAASQTTAISISLFQVDVPQTRGIGGNGGVSSNGGGNGGGGGGDHSSGISFYSTLGRGSGEIPDKLARLFMPQVPLSVARLQSKSHTRRVELLGPAVALWPMAPPTSPVVAVMTAAAPSPPRGRESLGTSGMGDNVLQGEHAGGRVRPGAASRLAPLQPLQQSLAAPSATTQAVPSSPAAGLNIVMRCPDVIASSSICRHRGGSDSSSDISWAASDRQDNGSETSSSTMGQVSQLVAWNRSGVIPLLQLDDSAEGCSRVTLLLPLPGPIPPAQPLDLQQPCFCPAKEREREGVRGHAGGDSVASSGVPGLGAAAAVGDAGARVLSRQSQNIGHFGSRTAPEGFQGGDGDVSGANDSAAAAAAAGSADVLFAASARAAQLVYMAWRRGQSLGPPCPLLLLPCGLEDVALELQAMQPPPDQPAQLSWYQAFLVDLGMWLEALHGSSSLSYTSSQPSSIIAGGYGGGNGSGGGGGANRPCQRSNPSLRSSFGHVSSPGLGTGSGFSVTAAAAANATGTSANANASPAHGDPLPRRYSLSNSVGSSPVRAATPPPRCIAGVSIGRLAAANPVAAEPSQDSDMMTAEASRPGVDLQQGTEEVSSYRTRGSLSAAGSTQQLPVPPASVQHTPGLLRPAAAAMQQQQQQLLPAVQHARLSQRAASGSTLLSGGSEGIEGERISRLSEVLGLGCDLLSFAIARGAVAVARMVMSLLMTHGTQLVFFTPLGGGVGTAASIGAAAPSPAVVTAGHVSATSLPPRPMCSGGGSVGGGPGGAGPSRLRQRSVAGSAGAEAAAAMAPGSGQARRAALLRAILDACRSSCESGHTLLHLAILSRSLPTVKLLLEAWPQEYGLPVAELNRTDKACLSPAAYLPAPPPSPPAVIGQDDSAARAAAAPDGDGDSAATEFTAAVAPMLLALGPALPAESWEAAPVTAMAAATAAAAASAPLPPRATGRCGLQAVQEGSNEAPSSAASGLVVWGPGASTGSGFVAVGSGGDAGNSTTAPVCTAWGARRLRVINRILGRCRSSSSSGGGGGGGGGALWVSEVTEQRNRMSILQPRRTTLEPLSSVPPAAAAAAAAAASFVAAAAVGDVGALLTWDEGTAAAARWSRSASLSLGGLAGSGDAGRPLLRAALWAAMQMLLGSVQALVALLVAMPRARDLPPAASLVALPGALLWLPSMCLILTSCLSAAATLLLPPQSPPPPSWRRWALPPWLPAAFTSAGRALACGMSLAAAVELSRAKRTAGGFRAAATAEAEAAAGGHVGLLTVITVGRGMSVVEASLWMLLMTLAPTALEAAYVDPAIRATLLVSEYGLPLLYVMLYDSVPAAVMWLGYAASNVVLGTAMGARMDQQMRASAAMAAATAAEAAAEEPVEERARLRRRLSPARETAAGITRGRR